MCQVRVADYRCKSVALLSHVEGVRYRMFQISVTMFLDSVNLNHICRLYVVYSIMNDLINTCIQYDPSW